MGRSKYSPEMRNAIMATFVTVTKGIIEEEGIEAASIRKVSTSAGFSSAALYLYFEDMNELIMMSLVSYLKDYVREIIETTPAHESAEEEYRRTWLLFCEHAFAEPSLFLNLFYGPQSENLDTITAKYYELFPSELEDASDRMLDMLERGNLRQRNYVILKSIAKGKGLSDREVELINDITIAYFQSFLQYAANHELDEAEKAAQVERFLEGAFFILRGGSAQ